MTQTSNRFFDEMARLMNDAAGVAQGVRREFDTVMRSQAERILRDLDIVKREEFEAVKEMARLAREENEALKARIAALETKLGYPYRALDWQSQNASLFSALKLEKLAMAFVVFLICVVAAFNVVGTLTMVVRDKTREIGILLAMGLRQAAIRRIFLTQGILVGLTGTVLGVLLGLVLGAQVNGGHWVPIDPSIYFIDHLPVHPQPVDVVLVVIASLVVATLAPLYPSLQASRLDPVTAIRYE